MCLQSLVPASAAALMAAARHPSGGIANITLWALHSLTVTAQSAGPLYMAQVSSTLTLCRDLLVSVVHGLGLLFLG